jgi:hypothetical protein
MQIITTIPALRPKLTRLDFLRVKRPKLRLSRSLASFFVTIGEAFQLAYVAPYDPGHRQAEKSAAKPDHRI